MFEINLVPDVKAEMIKAQRTRNVIALFCGFIVAAMLAVIFVLGGIKAGQDIAISNKKSLIEESSKTINSFSSLNSYLTVQSQLKTLSEVAENRKLLSRIFGLIWVFTPTNGDSLKYSEVRVNLDDNTVSFEAQAQGLTPPFDNYVVLEAFEKSVPMITYDYGTYLDANDSEIPSICIVESNDSGESLMDGNRLIARWTKGVKGCDPGNNINDEGEVIVPEALIDEDDVASAVSSGNYETIYRTPKFAEWFDKNGGEGYMNENGEISGIPHFKSECITYTYFDGKWGSNNTCYLAPDGVRISSKSNGRSTDSGRAVLKFNAAVTFDEAVFLAKNEHVIAIKPSGYINVTDSYVSISDLFTEEAIECNGVNCDILEEEGEE